MACQITWPRLATPTVMNKVRKNLDFLKKCQAKMGVHTRVAATITVGCSRSSGGRSSGLFCMMSSKPADKNSSAQKNGSRRINLGWSGSLPGKTMSKVKMTQTMALGAFLSGSIRGVKNENPMMSKKNHSHLGIRRNIEKPSYSEKFILCKSCFQRAIEEYVFLFCL